MSVRFARINSFQSPFARAAAIGVLAIALAGGVAQSASAALPTGPTSTGLTGVRPSASRLPFPISDQVSASVDIATGNLMVSTTWLALRGVAAAVPIGAAYNSLSTVVGGTAVSPANRWVFSIDGAGSLSQASAGVVYTGADGSTWLFAPVSGSTTAFSSPAGLKQVLVKGASSYTLTDLTSGQVRTFDLNGVPTKVANRNGNATLIGTNATGITTVTSSLGGYSGTATFAPYGPGGVGITQTSGNYTRTPSYFVTSNQLTNSQSTTFAYTSGNLTSITSAAGAITTFAYDGSGKVTQVDRQNTSPGSPGTSTTRISYPTTTQTLIAGPNTNTAVSVAASPHATYTIDPVTKLATGVTDAAGRVRSATYTPNQDVATSTTGTGTGSGTTTATYGANSGQSATSVQSPTGATNSAAYTNTAPGTQYLPSSTTNDAGSQNTFTYNGTGNALSSSNTALAATANVTYNTDGTVANATAPGNGTNRTIYGYTNQRLTSITPVTGSSLGVRTFTYDGFDRVRTATDGKGVTVTYTYDSADRLLKTAFSDGTPTVTNTYDGAGRITTRVDSAGATTYTYDQLGRLTSRMNTAGGGTISYGYDKASNLVSATDTRGTTTYAFDAAGIPTQLTYVETDSGAPVNHILGFATDNQGRRTDTWLDTNTTHTTWVAHTHTDYDTSSRPTRVVAEFKTATSGTLVTSMDQSYCYSQGSVAPTCSTALTSDRSKLQWSKNNLTGLASAYSYDGGGRLTQVAQTGTGANSYLYTYDSNGNRATATVTGANPATQSFTSNAANQINSTGYTYDGTGNMTADTAGSYTYNGAEQMTSVTKAGSNYTYTYAGTSQNEVLSETTPSGTYALTYGRTDQQGQAVIEQVKVGAVTAYVEHDPVTGQPLMLRTSSGKQSLYVYDGTGNPAALLTSDNYQAFAYSYDPYGVPTLTSNSGGSGVPQNPYLFKGGIQDRTTGWVHYGARWYNPGTGRWTQQDTLDAPLDPANANRYAYAGDDPINNLDPTGRYLSQCQSQAINLAIGAIGLGFAYGVALLALAGGVTTAAGITAIVTLGSGTGLLLTGYNDYLRDCT